MIRWYARRITKKTQTDAANALILQEHWFRRLIDKGSRTHFGREHQFDQIVDYRSFQERVPLRDYEGIRSYVERIQSGESDVLWPGRPKYFAKTSGTTSGAKYIPITQDSLMNHFGTARNALFNYLSHADHFDVFKGKLIFFSGSPELDKQGDILVGRLSGIVNHQVPSWLQTNKLPSYKTNCIEDWETKLDAIVDEVLGQPLTLIGGIPPWVQMFYERILSKTGAGSMAEVFPDFSVFVHGGVNYEPYQNALAHLVGKSIHEVETYPASEGFLAFQDRPGESGLLLNINDGIFFEFVPVEEVFNDNPNRMRLEEVELGQQYAIILNTNAGLWGYNIGDTVEFVSLNPYRIRVTGRIKHFISAFGEHVIAKEVDQAILEACQQFNTRIVEYSVAPQVIPPEGGLPYHEWFIEFEQEPEDLTAFSQMLDNALRAQNIYYEDLIKGQILKPLQIRSLKKGAFIYYMKSIGKLGEQNKVPRLKNDRSMADYLINLLAEKA